MGEALITTLICVLLIILLILSFIREKKVAFLQHQVQLQERAIRIKEAEIELTNQRLMHAYEIASLIKVLGTNHDPIPPALTTSFDHSHDSGQASASGNNAEPDNHSNTST